MAKDQKDTIQKLIKQRDEAREKFDMLSGGSMVPKADLDLALADAEKARIKLKHETDRYANKLSDLEVRLAEVRKDYDATLVLKNDLINELSDKLAEATVANTTLKEQMAAYDDPDVKKLRRRLQEAKDYGAALIKKAQRVDVLELQNAKLYDHNNALTRTLERARDTLTKIRNARLFKKPEPEAEVPEIPVMKTDEATTCAGDCACPPEAHATCEKAAS